MARMRTVKPALRTSQVVARWPREVRYFWVLLWGYLDDEGRGLDIPKTIAGDCFPLDDDVTPAKVGRWMDLIAERGGDKEPPLCRYTVDGRRYVHAVNWDEHQRPNRPQPSPHPPCPEHDSLTEPFTESNSESLTTDGMNDSVAGSRGFEGLRGRGDEHASRSEPPRRCAAHLQDRKPPNCVDCRDARIAHEAWQAAKRARLSTEPRCPRHPTQLARNCPSCRSERLGAA